MGWFGSHGRHRPDGARSRRDRDERSRRIVRVREGAANRLLGESLELRPDGGVDLEAARPNLRGSVHLVELVADVSEEVRLPDLAVQLARPETRLRFAGLPVLLALDDPGVEHRREHRIPPSERARRRDERIVDRRCLREPREQRRLRQRELARRLREVGSGGRFDSVGLIPVVDAVEVRREDLVLRPLSVELRRQARLLHLPLNGPLAGDVEVAHELLRDRRAALHDPARSHVGYGRSGDAFDVETAVIEETPVLDGDRRLAYPDGHLVRRDRLAVLLGGDDPEESAVRRVDERVLADLHSSQRGEVARRPVREDRRTAADGRRHTDGGQRRDRGDDRLPALPPTSGALSAVACEEELGVERGSARTP